MVTIGTERRGERPTPDKGFQPEGHIVSKHKKLLRIVGIVLYVVGVGLGIAFTAGAAWADQEAARFDWNTFILADGGLRPFSCPVAVTQDEVATVRAKLTNVAKASRDYSIRARVANRTAGDIHEAEQTATLAPGNSESFEWALSPDNAVYGRVILVRLYAPRNFSVPPRTASCGILVLGIPMLTGQALVAVVLAGSVVGMGSGLGLWAATHRLHQEQTQSALGAMALAAGLVVAGLIASLLGAWLVALVVLVAFVGVCVSIFGWRLRGE